MNFAAEPQKRCEAGHYKVLVTSAPLGPVGSIATASYKAGGATYALRPTLAVEWPINPATLHKLYCWRAPSVVAANGACARKPRHPPSLTIEDSGIFNTRYRHIAVSHAMLSCVKSAAFAALEICDLPAP